VKIVLDTKWLERLDSLAHRLHLPEFLLRPICDAYENRLVGGSPRVYCGDNTYTLSSNTLVTYTITEPKK
jgi:hypothetical protein